MLPHLTLTGHLDPPPAKLARAEKRAWLSRAAVWFETAGVAVLAAEPSEDGDGKPLLYVSYHPAAEDVEVRLSASGSVRVTAQTWPVGPGYHAYLGAALNAFAADLGVKWDRADDPTGVTRSGDAAQLSDHFLTALRTACRTALAQRPSVAALGLPADHGFTHPGPLLTPLGPRSWEWATAVAAEPTVGIEVFPWWSPDLDAEFFRNRAVAALWCEFPWRPPLTEDEGEFTDRIAADLEMAYSLDPAGPLPWREWAEVLAAIDADVGGFTVQKAEPELRRVVRRRAAEFDPAAPLIGYRRYPVRATVGNWSVEVPGSFADGWADARTWVAWDSSRKVMLRLGDPGFASAADGWRQISADGSLSSRIDSADRDWAAGVWESLRFVGTSDRKSSVA